MCKQRIDFNIALIGLGGVSEVHLAAYQSIGNVNVIAGADIDAERMKKVAQDWGFKGYTDYHDMLTRETIDAVVVCVPCRFHREVVEEVAAYGKPILVEKPLAASVKDAKILIDTCRQKEIPLMYGASYRFLPPVIKAREMIKEGQLGDISLLMEQAIGGQGLDKFQDLGPNHYYPGEFGGSGMGLVDHGIHLIDLFSWFLESEVISVFGQGNLCGEKPTPEFATLKYSNGAIAHLIYNDITFSSDLESEGIYSWGGSWGSGGTLNLAGGWESHPGSIKVHGSEGALRIYHYANHLYYFGRGGARPIKLNGVPMPGNFSLQLKSFVDALLNDDPIPVSADEGLKALEVIEALYKSMETGLEIKL